MSQVHEEIDYNEELPLEGVAEAERAEEEIDPNELELECIEEADGTNGTMPVKKDKHRDRQRDRRPHSTREEDRSRRDRDRISHRRVTIQDRIKRPHQHHSSSSSHSTSSRSKLPTARSEKDRISSQIDRDRRRREEHGLLKKRRMEGANGSGRHTHRHSHLASSSRPHAERITRKISPRRHDSSRDRDRERQRERYRNDREHRETDRNRHKNRNRTEDLDAIDLNDLEAVDECSGDEDWNTASEPSESQSRTDSSASVSASASDESASEDEELFDFDEPDYAAMKKAAQNSQPMQLLAMYREALEHEDEQTELSATAETSCTNIDEELTRDSNASSSKQRMERERATTSSSASGSSHRQQRHGTLPVQSLSPPNKSIAQRLFPVPNQILRDTCLSNRTVIANQLFVKFLHFVSEQQSGNDNDRNENVCLSVTEQIGPTPCHALDGILNHMFCNFSHAHSNCIESETVACCKESDILNDGKKSRRKRKRRRKKRGKKGNKQEGT
ncbi:hypothetical protein WR25_03378 [Diploscapter pachys]|uniref:Uncharacterized protein n=1 Tax=Diploscapter pachys TaxID=2018661 RepID=A0A2A2LL06_9BILA|nr:hypothetical protein WR25_03378 [Diploscapter pachys]